MAGGPSTQSVLHFFGLIFVGNFVFSLELLMLDKSEKKTWKLNI